MNDEEISSFWINYSIEDLANRCASLHRQRRELMESHGSIEIEAVRRTVSSIWIKGKGIEVGAGSRPFFIPDGSECYYGDIRDRDELSKYFSSLEVSLNGFIDAQTMAGIPQNSLDFVISAHVIEHLFDPIGAIINTIRVLKDQGIFLLVVPEKSKTWDRDRTATTLEHMMMDYVDGGMGTKKDAYVEHAKFVHPIMTGEYIDEDKIEESALQAMNAAMDIHVHAWQYEEFRELLEKCKKIDNFLILHAQKVQNENIFVLKKCVAS
ncbi:MAG: methyltransferase domain-containing protein [Betaproteobacteria bacterium]|nr:methyltransferase domain-containing protein [Betaproteobacteria bacterium]